MRILSFPRDCGVMCCKGTWTSSWSVSSCPSNSGGRMMVSRLSPAMLKRVTKERPMESPAAFQNCAHSTACTSLVHSNPIRTPPMKPAGISRKAIIIPRPPSKSLTPWALVIRSATGAVMTAVMMPVSSATVMAIFQDMVLFDLR